MNELIKEAMTYNTIKQMVEDGELQTTTDINEAIYLIGDLIIGGDFDCGIRGTDHTVLLVDGLTWQDILTYGVIVVPETSTYIHDTRISLLESCGLNRMSLNDNHIVGYKEEN